jgi:hypothetical protein
MSFIETDDKMLFQPRQHKGCPDRCRQDRILLREPSGIPSWLTCQQLRSVCEFSKGIDNYNYPWPE